MSPDPARQSSPKSAGSLVHRSGPIYWRAWYASGGWYLERIEADRQAAKLGVFVLHRSGLIFWRAWLNCERRVVSRAYQGRSAGGKARGFRARADP
eukprot:SAG11_NODE_21051_length_433_cov_0.622754_1_plen_95_part_10